MKQPSLFEPDEAPGVAGRRSPDHAAREFAVDPRHDVVLEASAGTGKTRVLVDRYVRLVEAGVDPRHVLAITFTRKAAAEMRERVLATLRRRAEDGTLAPAAWRAIRARMGDIQIATIDAFCFGLLREFPLEANVDPAFEIADETEIARFTAEALDLTMRAIRGLVATDEHVRLLMARVKQPVLRGALAGLINRRQVALPAIARFVGHARPTATATDAAARFLARLGEALAGSPERAALLADGPADLPSFQRLASDLASPDALAPGDAARVQHLRRRLEHYFLTRERKPRQRLLRMPADAFASGAARKRHEHAVKTLAPVIVDVLAGLDADLDRLLARGLLRVLTIAVAQYDALLEEHALLDFAGMLDRAVRLLERQEEFARSRLKLQARYHHLLVDEFQDTSRRQWRLVDLLIGAWAEGEGVADADTSVFIVGDRKQSIYRFRHAEVTLLDEAARRIGALRHGARVRQAISTSFRAVPELLAFVNALGGAMTGAEDLDDRWEYRDADRFPVPGVAAGARRDGRAVLGVVAEDSLARSAAAVAHEISRIIGRTVVRDRSGAPRPAQADDIAILFRARAGHRYFEDALDARGVRTYVYKGLGFFDAPEVQDLQALVRYLAQPDSDLRAAELLRSRLVRLSDRALVALAPALARALLEGDVDPGSLGLDGIDAELFERARTGARRWLALADRLPPSELVDVVLRESAYLVELGGRRMDQARENAKKVRALVRRVENRGYATLGRLAAYFDTLSAGDDSNAIVEAAGAVSLMTVHAAKGLEFPIVFVVNLHASGRGRSAGVSVIETGPSGEPDVAFRRTAATVLEDRREIEELRRLLYVAATRARDRLYLASEIDAHGRLRRGARSLAGLLPASLAATFEQAAASDQPEAEWDSGHGTFAFAICRAPEEAAPEPATAGAEPAGPEVPAATPLSAVGLVIEAATAQARTMPSGPAARGHRSAERRSERLAGTLVHRMFQRRFDAGADDAVLLPAMAELASLEERVDITDWAGLCRTALELYRAMRGRADVAALVEGGRCLYEVPFSYLPPDRPGVCIRGVVDCLVEGADGALTVLEFKTGGPRDEHRVQAEFYGRAMESAIGRGPVRAVVCYPERTLQEKHCM